MYFSEEELEEMVGEVTEETVDRMLLHVRDVLKDIYEWENLEISKFLLYVGLQMVSGKEEKND